MSVFWLIACVTLIMNGCVSRPDFYMPVDTQVAVDPKTGLLNPRAIEEWADPDDQELARRLTIIDEQRKTLNTLMENLRNARKNRKGSGISPTDLTRADTNPEAPHQELNVEALFAELGGQLNQVKWYPPIAIKNRWEGKVEIDVYIRDNGEYITAWIFKSSGYPVLDHTALETVRLAFPLRLKEHLSRPVLTIRVPISYAFEDPL